VFVLSYANLDNVPTFIAGASRLLASDWNTYVRDNFDSLKRGHISVADSAARTALSVAAGTVVYQEDDKVLWVFDGSAWYILSEVTQSTSSLVDYDPAPKNDSGDAIVNVATYAPGSSWSRYRVGAGFFSLQGLVYFNNTPSNMTKLFVRVPIVNGSGGGNPEIFTNDPVIPNYTGVIYDYSTGARWELVFRRLGEFAGLDSDYVGVAYRTGAGTVADVTSTAPFTFDADDTINWWGSGYYNS